MNISKRKYYSNSLSAMVVMGVLLIMSTLIANKIILHLDIVDRICRYMIMCMVILVLIIITVKLILNNGLKGYIRRHILLDSVESNLISVGAYEKRDNKNYVVVPKIKINEDTIIINLRNMKMRAIIERYLNSFSTALPKRYIVEDYYISKDNAEIIIEYEDIKDYKSEEYTLIEYMDKVKSMDMLDLYFDKKHIVNLKNYPHLLISGTTGSGKSYLANQIVIQAIIKGYDVVILDLKRSYGLYRNFTDYVYEIDDILEKLQSVESEMALRMEKLQPELDKNPNILAVDIGYKPMLVVVEEYISLQSSLDKKNKEELERVIKNISVLARQSNIHLMIVLQSAGTENIQSTTRSNMTKVLLGNAQSNILTATFGSGVDIPNINTKMNKGEGLIQLDKISILRVPKVNDIENFNNIM